ncbi:MAG: peptidase M16 [Flavobacteriales bacterium]|nr:peptidase M16 [Flavobacteriales bacterium]
MMNKIILTITFFIAATTLNAQYEIDRSSAPKPGKAPEINIGSPASFVLENGLKVFVVENHKLPKVSFQLSIDKDPKLETGHVGLSSMMGDMLSAGTTTKTKQQIDEEIDFIGASISTFSSGIYASCLSKHKEKVLEIASDILLNPAFPEQELEKKKKRLMSSLKSVKTDANSISSRVGGVLKYGKNHPYGEVQTSSDIDGITVELCKEYYKTYFRPNISYLVIVGDIDVEESKALVENYFGSWEKAEVPIHKYSNPEKVEGVRVAFVDKPGAVQSLISVMYPIDYKIGAQDNAKVSVMSNIFGGAFSSYLNANLREDKGYTYGARGRISPDKIIGQFNASASVRNEVTDSSISEFLAEMNHIKNEPVSDEDLNRIKNNMNGDFALSLERSQTIARFALNVVRFNLPQDYYQTYLSRLQSVSKEDVQAAAKKYIDPDNCIILVVGNKEVAESLKKFDSDGEIEFYDINGDIEKEEKTPLPEGLTAQQVINDYLLAITGKENLDDVKKVYKKLKGIKSVMNGAISQGGQEFSMTFTTYQKAPNSFKMEINAMGMVVQKEVFNGSTGGSMNMQTGKQDLSAEEIAKKKITSALDKELRYKELGYQLELMAIEKVNDVPTYKVAITNPFNSVSYAYFDVDSKLKVSEMKIETSSSGESATVIQYFSDYQSSKYLKYPNKVVVENNGQEIELNVSSVEYNPKFSSDEFSW